MYNFLYTTLYFTNQNITSFFLIPYKINKVFSKKKKKKKTHGIL